MSIAIPIRLDRMQSALVDVLESGLSGFSPPILVHWARTEPSHESLGATYVTLDMIAAPSPINRAGARGTLLNPTSSIDITVDSAVTGQRYGIELNGYLYFTDGAGGDTEAIIRDRLVALIEADAVEPVTAAAAAGDALSLTADFDGAMRCLRLVGELSSSNQVVSSDSVTVTEGDQLMLINVQVFSKETAPRLGAPIVMATVYSVLQSPDYIQDLVNSGVGVHSKGVPTSIPAVEGGRWEGRQSMDVELSMVSGWVRPAGRIESAVLTTTLQPGDITVETTVTAS